MSKTEIQQLVDDALSTKIAIDAIMEDKVAPLAERLEGYKAKLEREMQKLGVKDLVGSLGTVIWVDRQGNLKLDEKALCKALGVETLSDYKKRGRGTHFLQFQPEGKKKGKKATK